MTTAGVKSSKVSPSDHVRSTSVGLSARPFQMRSLEKRQYEIEQGLRDPSELLGAKSKGDGEDGEDEEESEAAKTARAENLTKTAMAAANKLMKSTDAVERMKGTAMMTAAKLGLAVPKPEPGEEGVAKAKTPQEALKEATAIALRYFRADGQVRGIAVVVLLFRCPCCCCWWWWWWWCCCWW